MLTIPDEHLKFIKATANLSESELISFTKALEIVGIKEDINGLISEISNLSGVEKSTCDSILRIVGSINSTASKFNQKKSEVINDLVTTLCTDDENSITLSEATIDFLNKISENEIINATMKCESLKLEFENIYASAKIITDIRPIFSDDGRTILSTTIVNTLILESYQNEGCNSQSFSLDETDIDSFVNVLERAKLKIAVLKEFIGKEKTCPK